MIFHFLDSRSSLSVQNYFENSSDDTFCWSFLYVSLHFEALKYNRQQQEEYFSCLRFIHFLISHLPWLLHFFFFSFLFLSLSETLQDDVFLAKAESFIYIQLSRSQSRALGILIPLKLYALSNIHKFQLFKYLNVQVFEEISRRLEKITNTGHYRATICQLIRNIGDSTCRKLQTTFRNRTIR